MRIVPFPLVLLLAGCSAAYYGALEQVGFHKREILVDRVAAAQDSQEEAAQQFQSALEQFQAVVAFEGGDLEKVYDELSDELDRSERRAEAVRDRIVAVEGVAAALFDEWEDELEAYSDARLQARSRESLVETRGRYDRLMRAMHRAEGRLEPVLAAFRDQVLFLKHNLNARAIGSLQDELATIESDVEVLVAEMNRSIAEARAFIDALAG